MKEIQHGSRGAAVAPRRRGLGEGDDAAPKRRTRGDDARTTLVARRRARSGGRGQPARARGRDAKGPRRRHRGERRHGARRARPGRRVRRADDEYGAVVAQQQLSDVYSAYVDVMRGYRGPDSRGPERRARAPRARLTQQYSAIRLFARIWHRNRVIARVLRRRLRIHRGATRLRSRVSPATPRSVTAPLARAFPRASVLETLASLATSAGGDF